MHNCLPHPLESRPSIMERAEQVQANLAVGSLNFVKVMLPSNMTRGFTVRLPREFCALHMPRHNSMVTLVDESEEEFEIHYCADRMELSAGWRKFSRVHNLLEGDALIFHLVEPNKNKVYRVSTNRLAERNGAVGLLNTVGSAEPEGGNCAKTDFQNHKLKCLKHLPPEVVRENCLVHLKTCLGPVAVECPVGGPSGAASEYGSRDLGSEVSEALTSRPSYDFERVSCIENFTVTVNGSKIDYNLPHHVWTRYYEFCCSQRSFLHARLIRNVTRQLAVKIISETLSFANAITDSMLFTSRADFTNWGKSLEDFQMMEMNVGSLRARLDELASLAFESKGEVEVRRYREALEKRYPVVAKALLGLELELRELKGRVMRLEGEMKSHAANVKEA